MCKFQMFFYLVMKYTTDYYFYKLYVIKKEKGEG